MYITILRATSKQNTQSFTQKHKKVLSNLGRQDEEQKKKKQRKPTQDK